jgi:hypothetical protein
MQVADLQYQQQEDMVEDIMANNNLVEAGFVNREDIIMSNLYTLPSQNFFNMKD